MSEHQDAQAPDLAQVAYEARFRGMTLGLRGVAPAWADLGPEGRAVWQRVADEVLTAGGMSLAQAGAAGGSPTHPDQTGGRQ